VHLDGARLWECSPAYGRGLDDIAALFDTVYLSLYKKIGGLSGCCVAGPDDVISQLREWRLRHGGTLFALWPYAASDLAALRKRLPKMAAYHEHALAIATALRGLEGVEVVPQPPHTSMMNLLIRSDAERLRAAALKLAEEEGIWAVGSWSLPTDSPHVQRVTLDVGDATLAFSPDEVRQILERIIEH
jgi:threonine aldolase